MHRAVVNQRFLVSTKESDRKDETKLKIRAILKGPAKLSKRIMQQNWLISGLKKPAAVANV